MTCTSTCNQGRACTCANPRFVWSPVRIALCAVYAAAIAELVFLIAKGL